MKGMYRLVIGALVLLGTAEARAQLMFQTTFDKVSHPKSEWEQWSTTKVGDFIEYGDGKTMVARFEAVKVGDHEMTIRTITMNPLTNKPLEKLITHTFENEDQKFGKPTNVVEEKLKLGDEEFATRKEEFLFPDGKMKIKEVWYSDAAPFDGMLKYQQYTQGQPGDARLATTFKKGSKTFK